MFFGQRRMTKKTAIWGPGRYHRYCSRRAVETTLSPAICRTGAGVRQAFRSPSVPEANHHQVGAGPQQGLSDRESRVFRIAGADGFFWTAEDLFVFGFRGKPKVSSTVLGIPLFGDTHVYPATKKHGTTQALFQDYFLCTSTFVGGRLHFGVC